MNFLRISSSTSSRNGGSAKACLGVDGDRSLPGACAESLAGQADARVRDRAEVDEFMKAADVPFDYTVSDFEHDRETSEYLREARSKEIHGR